MPPGGTPPLNPGYGLVSVYFGARSFAFYLTHALFPLRLSPFYPFPKSGMGGGVISLLALSALAVYLLSRVLSRKDYPRSLVFGGLFFLVTLLPVCRLIPFGGKEIFALRFMYLPLLGLSFLAAAGLRRSALKSWRGRVVIGALIMAAVIFAVLSRAKIAAWKNSTSLWREVLKYYPEFSLAHSNLASVYYYQKDYEAALLHSRRAIASDPGLAYPYVLQGLSLRNLGDPAAARESFLRGKAILKRTGSPRALAQVEKYLRALPRESGVKRLP